MTNARFDALASKTRPHGFYLETAAAGDYRVVCFMADSDGA